jgi:hypothetical protein
MVMKHFLNSLRISAGEKRSVECTHHAESTRWQPDLPYPPFFGGAAEVFADDRVELIPGRCDDQVLYIINGFSLFQILGKDSFTTCEYAGTPKIIQTTVRIDSYLQPGRNYLNIVCINTGGPYVVTWGLKVNGQAVVCGNPPQIPGIPVATGLALLAVIEIYKRA